MGVLYEVKHDYLNYSNQYSQFPFFHSIGIGFNYQISDKPRIKLESRILISEERVLGYWSPWIMCFPPDPAKANSKYLKLPLFAKIYLPSKRSKKFHPCAYLGINPVLLLDRTVKFYDWNDKEVSTSRYSIFRGSFDNSEYEIPFQGGVAFEYVVKRITMSPYIQYSNQMPWQFNNHFIYYHTNNYLSAGLAVYF